MQDVVIIGAGGFGREVLDVFDAVNLQQERFNVLGFIVDEKYGQAGTIINDKPILGDFEWFARYPNVKAICAVGSPSDRYSLVMRVNALDVQFCTVIHPSVIKTRWINIGEGCVITAGCVLSNQIKIGNHVHINPSCTIGHDVTAKDYVTLSPSASISGNVTLGEGCFIGTGANILEKKLVGDWAVVGAGSTVVNDVPPNTTVVGIPGKVIKRRDVGWHLT